MNESQPHDGLYDIISAAVAAKLTPEFVEQHVASRVEKLIVDVIDSSMRSWGDLGKTIEAAVKNALKVHDLNLPSYGALITGILEREVRGNAERLIEARLVQDMRELLSIAPDEVKLSEIARDMLEARDDDTWGQVITVIVGEPSYGSHWLYLDPDHAYSERDKHKCAHRLLVNASGKIAVAYINGASLTDINVLGRGGGLADKIRAWYAAGTKIILDADEVVTARGDF